MPSSRRYLRRLGSDELGDLPTLAEALVLLGMTGVTSGAATELGIDALERARDVAGRCGHALAGAQAALELARALTGLGAGAPTSIADDGRAAALITEARTLSAQLGRPLRVEVELANVESAVLLRSGARAGAVAVLTAALEQVEDHHGIDSPERVPLLIRRAAMRAELGELKGATEDAGAAAVVLRSTLGPGHVGMAQCLDFHGHFLLVSGRLDEAHVIYDEVASLLDSTPRADPIRRLWCDNKRGQIALARRDLAAARRWFGVALTGYRALPGPLHWYAVYGPIDLLALTEWLDGHFDDAERYADELIERSRGMVPPPLYGRYVRAELWARAGRTAEAHGLLDTIAEAGGVPVGMSDGLTMSLDVWRARVWAHEGRLGDAEATLERAIGDGSPERPIGDLEARADHARVRLMRGEASAPEEVRAVVREASDRGVPLTTPLRMALGGC